jgi:hypothetical protein
MWKISDTLFENTRGNENFIQGELKIRLRFVNAFISNILCLYLLSRNMKIKTHKYSFIFVLYGCESCGLSHQENVD